VDKKWDGSLVDKGLWVQWGGVAVEFRACRIWIR